MGYEGFLLWQFKSKFISKESFDILLNMSCIFFTADYPNQKIIGVSHIFETFVTCIHFVTAWNKHALGFVLFVTLNQFGTFSFIDRLFKLVNNPASFVPKRTRGLISFSVLSLVEVLDVFFHILIQFVEVYVCQQWAYYSPLWSTAISSMKFPIFDVTCFQQFAD